MNRDELVRTRKRSWQRLEELLLEAEKRRGVRAITPSELRELAEIYRGLAGDLMRVQRDKLGAELERYLHGLAARAHNALYGGTSVGQRLHFAELFQDFPGAVRRNGRLFGLACLLFFGTFILAGIASFADESYASAFLSSAQLESMEQMYKEAKTGRDANSDAVMTGYYVDNNVGIAFRCFATGAFFGLGSVFFLVFNGLMIGAVFGHLFRVGLGDNLLGFVSTHSSWELVAIAIAGGAGLQMGLALVSTRGRTRAGSLRAHGLELLRQILGAGLFLLLAAVFEGWLSPSELPREAKYGIGLAGWCAVGAILALFGRGRELPSDVRALRGEA